jgi:uncharacterized cupredoxin-like copper-binding protein
MNKLNTAQTSFLKSIFGDRAKFQKLERKLYGHDMAVMPSLVKPLKEVLMRNISGQYAAIISAFILLALAACAGVQQQVAVSPGTGEKVIGMTADNFKFIPNNIKAARGDVLVIKIENISKSEHNFTIKNPQGNILQDGDIPPGKTAEFRVPLPEAGEYDFYCDEPFHTLFGMKGQIEVTEK